MIAEDAAVAVLMDEGVGRRYLKGTAYHLGGGLYLTLSGIFGQRTPAGRRNVAPVFIRLADSTDDVSCHFAWSSPDGRVGVVILQADEQHDAPDEELPQWGRLKGTSSHQCAILGFPRFAQQEPRYPDDPLTIERITGTINLPTVNYTGSPVLKVAEAPLDAASLTSPWYGIGGAPVFSQGTFIGIVQDAQTATRLSVLPAAALARNSDLTRFLKDRMGAGAELVDIEAADAGIESAGAAIHEVARTDPKNIQEVAAAQFSLSNAYYENVLSQARRSFSVAAISAALGTIFFFVAVTIAMRSAAFEAAIVSAVSGGIVEVIAGLNFWLYARTASQLNAFHVRLERMQKYLLANSVCSNLSPEARDAAMADLVRTIATDVAPAGETPLSPPP